MVNSGCECTNNNWTNGKGNYYTSVNISSQYMNTDSSALESCHCRGYIYTFAIIMVIIKHTWHRITSTSKILWNTVAQVYRVIPFVDISPCISLSQNLCDRYPVILQSCIDYQLNCLSYHGYLFIDSVNLSLSFQLVTCL